MSATQMLSIVTQHLSLTHTLSMVTECNSNLHGEVPARGGAAAALEVGDEDDDDEPSQRAPHRYRHRVRQVRRAALAR